MKNIKDQSTSKFDFEIQGNYGEGWECVHTEPDIGLARQSLINFEVNEPEYAHRIVRVSTKNTEENGL